MTKPSLPARIERLRAEADRLEAAGHAPAADECRAAADRLSRRLPIDCGPLSECCGVRMSPLRGVGRILTWQCPACWRRWERDAGPFASHDPDVLGPGPESDPDLPFCDGGDQ